MDLNNAGDVELTVNDVVEEVGLRKAESQESHIDASQEELASLTVSKLKDRRLPISGMSDLTVNTNYLRAHSWQRCKHSAYVARLPFITS